MAITHRRCIHRAASLQELDDIKEYDMKRDLVEINHDAPQWSHHAVWNRRYMEPKPGYTLQQWADSEPTISKKTTPSYEIQTNNVSIQHLPSSTPPDSPFLSALGTSAALKAPPQTDTLAQRAVEEWERTLCENKAVAILAEVQAGRPTLIHKNGGEMLIAIVLDRPLAEAKALVDDPAAFTREMTRILREKQSHPLLAQMMKPAESSDPLPATTASSSTGSSDKPRTTPHVQFQQSTQANVGYLCFPYMQFSQRLDWGLRGFVTMGYPWLTTTYCSYLCRKHAGVSMGRETVGGGYNNYFKGTFSCRFTLIVAGSVVRCQSTSSHGARRRLTFVQPTFRPAK